MVPATRGRNTEREKVEDKRVNDRALPDAIRRRLASPLPGLDAQSRMSPRPRLGADLGVDIATLRPAAALLLIYPHREAWHVPLTYVDLRCVTTLDRCHFRVDGSTPVRRWSRPHSAKRTRKSVCIHRRSRCWACSRRSPVYISGHLLQPVVGVASQRPDFSIASHEVDQLLEVPLALLREPERVLWEERPRLRPKDDRND